MFMHEDNRSTNMLETLRGEGNLGFPVSFIAYINVDFHETIGKVVSKIEALSRY